MKKLIFSSIMLGFATVASAQNTVVVVQPDEWAFIRDAGKKDAERVGQGIGNMLNAALHKKQAKSVVLVIRCNHYTEALVTYDDGSLKSINLIVEGNEVDRTELAAYQAALPNLKVVDGGC
jgi:hypothetical protein